MCTLIFFFLHTFIRVAHSSPSAGVFSLIYFVRARHAAHGAAASAALFEGARMQQTRKARSDEITR